MYINNFLSTLTTESLKCLNNNFKEPLSSADSSYNSFLPKNSFLENNYLSTSSNTPLKYISTKILDLGSCAFRQWKASHSHCKFLHGYQLKAKFWFESNTLDDKNWVVDFGGLKELEKTLKDQFDHKLCVAKDDPLLQLFEYIEYRGGCTLRIMDSVGIEKTAEWCLKAAEKFLKTYASNKARVQKVEVFEHENNSAIVEASEFWALHSPDVNYFGT